MMTDLDRYEIGDIVYALNRDEMSGSMFGAYSKDDGSGWLTDCATMDKASAYALLLYYRRREHLPEDVVTYLCAIAGLDPSGVALDLLRKYAPALVADMESPQ